MANLDSPQTVRASSDTRAALEMRSITKRFPGVIANDGISFDLRKGEIHALLGENGAGKSTLMNILYGLYQPDEGEILLDGQPVKITSPRVAIQNGIGMVHQHFMLVPTLTVAENIVLGMEVGMTMDDGRRTTRNGRLSSVVSSVCSTLNLPLTASAKSPRNMAWRLTRMPMSKIYPSACNSASRL